MNRALGTGCPFGCAGGQSPAAIHPIARITLGLALGLALAAAGLAPAAALAQSAGTKALINQAQYWQAKARADLAMQAWRRVLALEPNNALARRALSPTPPAEKAPAPAAPAVASAPPAPRSAPAARPAAEPAPTRRAAGKSAADLAGDARVAGLRALQNGDLDGAVRAFQAALARNRRDSDALGGTGLVALKRGNFTQARDLLEQASQGGDADKWRQALESARYFAALQEARDLVQRGSLPQARAAAEALVHSGYAQNGSAIALLADIAERENRFADAADLYRQAGAGGGDDAGRLQSRAARADALTAAARGDDIGAEQAFRQGMLLAPDDPWIRYEFARFMTARGRAAESDSAIRLLAASSDPDALYAAAMLHADQGRTEAAQSLMDRIPPDRLTAPMKGFMIGLKVDDAIARAKAIAAQGRGGEGTATLRQLGATPGLPAAKLAAIADALDDMGDAYGAGTLAQQALAGPIDSLDAYGAIVRIAARSGRDDLARTALARAGRQAGSDPAGQRTVARLAAGGAAITADRLRRQGQLAQAFDVLQQAWSAAPDSTEVLASLARLYQSGRMNARAAQTFQMILAHDPRDRDALTGLMETAQAAGDKALSQQAENTLLSTYPDRYESFLAAARVEQARGNAGAATRYFRQARTLYTQAAGGGSGNPFAASPFAADGADGTAPMAANPFRNASPASAPAPVNPFALGGGTRLPAPGPEAGAAAAMGFGPADARASADPQAGAPGNWSGAGYVPQPGGGYPVGGGWPGAPSTAPMTAAFPASGDGAPVSVDPVLAGIERDIAQISADNGPRAEGDVSYRSRSGETGLSKLGEVTAQAKLSTGLGGGRIYAGVKEVVISSGRPTGDSLGRFGTDATIAAQAIVDAVAAKFVNATDQRASGVAVNAGYADKLVQVEGGTTPIGMGKTKATWHAQVSPQVAEHTTLRAYTDRKPVTDSVVSYAGTVDPVTGQRWGQVMRTSGGGGVSYDNDGTGVYADASYSHYSGENVPANHSIEVNAGAYIRAWNHAHSSLTAGINVNYQKFGNNQSEFTYGNGGYFSPENFLAVGFPVRYAYQNGKLDVKLSATPGFQTYSQAQSNLYPGDAALQARLDVLKAANYDVRNYYDSLSKTGFGISAEGSAWYSVSAATRIGGEASYNTFGGFDETRVMLGIRQALGNTK